MDRVPVDSSNVAEIGYDLGSSTLEVMFNDGSLYQYFDVPESVYDDFVRAESHGGYLHANIRGEYRYARV